MSVPIDHLNAALRDRYRIKRELGEGGMATVYLAEDRRHGRSVALKVLRPELAAVVGADRFLAEIRTTANLQHPHILPLFDSGEADSFLFYVMPYVGGESLRARLDREKQLGVGDAVSITRKVAGALEYAHGRGVVHRDIKPGNILLSEQGEPLVADFGIALAVAHAGAGRLTETGLSLGTPHYMSPEQATGERDVNARTDIYSLGCVLFEMLAGRPPYTAPTAQAVLAKILTADRFANAAQFGSALGNADFRYATSKRTLDTAPGSVRALASMRKKAPSNPLAVAFAVAAALLGGLAAWGWLRPMTHAPLMVTSIDVSALPSPDLIRASGEILVSPDGSRFAVTVPRTT